jgi:hypothetical protein
VPAGKQERPWRGQKLAVERVPKVMLSQSVGQQYASMLTMMTLLV